MRRLELMLLISDTHVGKKTETYSVNAFRRRMTRLKKEVSIALNKLKDVYVIEKFNIFLLGDILDGEGVYPAQGVDLEATVVESVKVFLEKFDELVSEILSYGLKVNIYCVYGNHGRVSKYAKSNWEEVLYMMIQQKYSSDNVRVVQGGWYVRARIGNKYVMATHGDQIRMYQNVPLYGVVQKAMRWQGSVGRFDVLVLGHFHTTYMMSWNGILIFGNGTMMDGDDWTAKLGLKPQLKFWLIGIGEQNEVEFAKLIDLE